MDTVKIIDTQQKFANSVYQDFMSKRFGITTCSSGDMDATHIKKQLCDWQSLDIKLPEILTITSEVFIPSTPLNPCTDATAPSWCSDCSNNPSNAAELKKELEELEKVLEVLRKVQESLEDEIAQVEEVIEASQTEINNLTTLIDQLTQEIAQHQAELAQLQQTEQEKQQELDLKQKEYDANCNPTGPEPFCSNLAAEIDQLALELKILTNDINVLEETIAEKENLKAEYEALLQKEQAQLEELEAVLSDLQEELASTEAQIAFYEEQKRSVEAQFCVDDAECVLFEVVDSNGNPVKDFELYIDRIGTVLTNSAGQYRHTFFNSSVDTEHSLQLCYCFTTAGACRQQKITLTIKADEVEDCQDVVPCNTVTITETIIGEQPAPVPPPPPPTPLNCPLPDCEQIDELIFDQTGQVKYAINYNDIDGFKVSDEELNTFNGTEPEASDYRAKRDVYLQTMNLYSLGVYENGADPNDTSSISCEPLQILSTGSKYGFTNLATPIGIKASQYGIPFELTYLEPVADVASLPPSGSQGQLVLVEEASLYYHWDPNTNSWVTDYTVNGISIDAYATWSRSWRDALLKSINEFQLAIDPFNWTSLYIPDFHLNKYF